MSPWEALSAPGVDTRRASGPIYVNLLTVWSVGVDDGDRTRDIRNHNPALYH